MSSPAALMVMWVCTDTRDGARCYPKECQPPYCMQDSAISKAKNFSMASLWSLPCSLVTSRSTLAERGFCMFYACFYLRHIPSEHMSTVMCWTLFISSCWDPAFRSLLITDSGALSAHRTSSLSVGQSWDTSTARTGCSTQMWAGIRVHGYITHTLGLFCFSSKIQPTSQSTLLNFLVTSLYFHRNRFKGWVQVGFWQLGAQSSWFAPMGWAIPTPRASGPSCSHPERLSHVSTDC